MTRSAVVVAIVILNTSISLSQNENENYAYLMNKAKVLKSQGDYLTSCRIMSFISTNAKDSLLVAESLYHLVEYSEEVLPIIENRFLIRSSFKNLGSDSVWVEDFKLYNDQFLADFGKLGIEFRYVSYFESYWIVNDTTIRPLLAEKFPNSFWGEKATFDLITNEINSYGTPKYNHPRPVLNKAKLFLSKYPSTDLFYDAYFIIGKAYSDIWNLSQIREYSDILNDDEKDNSDFYRLQAIKYYEIVRHNKNKLKAKFKTYHWSPYYDEQLKLLRDKKRTGVLHFFGD